MVVYRGGRMSMRQDAPYRNWNTTSRDDGARVEPPRDPETRPPETPEIEQPKRPARIAQPPREPRTEPPAEPSIIPPAEPQIEPPDRREAEEVKPERPAAPERGRGPPRSPRLRVTRDRRERGGQHRGRGVVGSHRDAEGAESLPGRAAFIVSPSVHRPDPRSDERGFFRWDPCSSRRGGCRARQASRRER